LVWVKAFTSRAVDLIRGYGSWKPQNNEKARSLREFVSLRRASVRRRLVEDILLEVPLSGDRLRAWVSICRSRFINYLHEFGRRVVVLKDPDTLEYVEVSPRSRFIDPVIPFDLKRKFRVIYNHYARKYSVRWGSFLILPFPPFCLSVSILRLLVMY